MANFFFTLLITFGILFTRYPKNIRRLLIGLVGLNLVLLCLFYTANHFSRAGINEAVIAHLHYLLNFNTLIRFWPIVLIVAVCGSAIFYLTICLNAVTDAKRIRTRASYSRLISILIPILLLIALASNPVTVDITLLYHQQNLANRHPLPEEFEDIERLAPPIHYESPAKKPNFVIIFAESLERSFLDNSEYPGLTPNLQERIKQRGIDIEGVKQLTLSNWTDSGLTAALCGVSMAPNYSDFGLDSGQLTPRIIRRTKATNIIGETCIGDILASDDYKMTFIGGSEFGIKEKKIHTKSQGFESIYSTKDIIDASKPPLTVTTWGVYDDALFSFADQKLREETDERPFGMVILTLDTHSPGYISPSCGQVSYSNHESQLLDAVHCSDQLISKFIDRIDSNPKLRDTIIILASDHLLPGALPNSLKRGGNRDNTLVIFNSHLINSKARQHIKRLASTLDTGPTILAHLGYKIATLNFGRNLMLEAPSLTESMSHATLSKHIVKIRRKMVEYWKTNNDSSQDRPPVKNNIKPTSSAAEPLSN
jgi:phosphoglycerol transferase